MKNLHLVYLVKILLTVDIRTKYQIPNKILLFLSTTKTLNINKYKGGFINIKDYNKDFFKKKLIICFVIVISHFVIMTSLFIDILIYT